MGYETKIKLKHELRRARMRAGLEQKQVAYLLDCPTTEQISRYETGKRVPSLATAIKLGMIYSTPLSILLRPLFERAIAEINERRRPVEQPVLPLSWAASPDEPDADLPPCVYAQLLDGAISTVREQRMVRKHVMALMRAVSRAS